MSYQSVLERVRAASERRVMAAWRMYGKGLIDRDEFVRLASSLLGKFGAHAAAAADFAVSHELTVLERSLQPAKGVDAARKERGYEKALLTILEGDGDIVGQLSRLSLNAPLEAAQVAYDDAVAMSGKGWVRQLDPDPCQLCRWWWREGQVWPADHPMPTHPGCECVARPVNN